MESGREIWAAFGEALAFCGNALLSPMNATGDIGIDSAFWTAFPDFGDERVAEAIGKCRGYAERAAADAERGDDPARAASVEFARLFIGPPKPAAPPWESMYGPVGQRSGVGFGKAAVDMRRLISDAGLQMANDNNQYPDHMGIELLYAAFLCRGLTQPEDDEGGALELRLDNFIGDHPLGWIDELSEAVRESAPQGYVINILELAKALLQSSSRLTRECTRRARI